MKHWEGWVVLIIVLLILAYAVKADDEGLDLRRLPKTDNALAIYLTPQDPETDMKSMLIKVPHLDGGTVIVCFKMHNKHETNCFYNNDETGEVILKKVPTNEEDT